MGYQTILVHADLSRHAPARIRCAAALCAEHGAHLIGAAMTGVARAVFPNGYDASRCTLLASYIDPLQQAARRALDAFEEIARQCKVSHEARLVCDDIPDGLTRLARFADLLVVSQDDPGESLGYAPPADRMPDHIVYHAGRPVLIVPTAPTSPSCPRRILLCWNGSRESSAAMAGAVPLLARAEHVTLAVLAESCPSPFASKQELDDAQSYLSRHGIAAQLAWRDPRGDSGRAILALAAELGCDTVVMGCFGRSQLHELLLGGASRLVLRDATVLLLMAR